MSKNKLIRNFALTISIAAASVSLGFAQDKDQPSQDPTTKVRTVKAEIKKAYKVWLNNDVAYIITNEEKKAFKSLKTDEERENFIESFLAPTRPES